MKKCVDYFKEAEFLEEALNKVTHIKTEELGSDVYYFKSGQVLDFHRHKSDQIFFVLKGEGTFYLEDQDGNTEQYDVRPGFSMLAPKTVWHKLVNTGSDELIAVQVTYLPTDLEQKK
ncbi:hypothetical protein BHU72_03960 [Desulfuribacillus stibiiarsenatis]|uniref:Cupin type-2 domain-containing protein n=1 Tax=Desulfuribacillus stibiiarsenatis TaxID=1390249 RepID=A0A1E5L7D9_9FIRM|nr:cupin domain-containing protein [Desulfuribacillus stibiiarsenatis]OEH85934.1 hypothetical protein BHU72_03960 [Desulfuribacillus stibiiarsenatis]